MSTERLVLSKKAQALLRRIGNTEEAALRLTRGSVKAANELRSAGLVEFISISTGGCDVCLNARGLEIYDGEEVH